MEQSGTQKSCRKKITQVSIELILGMFAMALLFLASARLFVWFCNDITGRQSRFQATRTIDGSKVVSPDGITELGYEPPEMNLLGED